MARHISSSRSHANDEIQPYAKAITLALLAMFSFCSIIGVMTKPDSLWLAQSLLNAPGWARVALTAPNERLREQAAVELVQTIIVAWERQPVPFDGRQMILPL